MNWISVKKRKPKIGREVLCYMARACKLINGNWVPSQRVLLYLKIFPKRPPVFADKDYFTYDPTHWKYLPKPPENIDAK